MSWSELRDSDADSPTTCRIARLAGCSEVEALGYQARLWCWTLRHAPTGDLGVSPEELEIALGWRGASGALASALLAVQAVEITDESGVRTVRVVGWESRCRLGRERARWQARAERARASAETPRSTPETPRIEERRGEEIRGDQIRDTVSAVAPTVTPAAPPERPRRQRAPRPVDDSPVLATLAVRDGELWRLTEARAQRLRAGYPAVDLQVQIARVDEWLTRQTNSHLPTARGMPAFLARWLSR
ncbi:hypothetical protein EBZ39_17170, partial [bacterium]|nr:hypothetical protein [bacterium]